MTNPRHSALFALFKASRAGEPPILFKTFLASSLNEVFGSLLAKSSTLGLSTITLSCATESRATFLTLGSLSPNSIDRRGMALASV